MTREIRDVTRDKKLWRTFFISPGNLYSGRPSFLADCTQNREFTSFTKKKEEMIDLLHSPAHGPHRIPVGCPLHIGCVYTAQC